MDSYRLIINNYDESSVTSAETSGGAIGYTVVKSPKGPTNNKPVLITSVSQLHKVFGKPSSTYPELFEAETFIANGHRLYVCSAGAAAGAKNTKEVTDTGECSEGHFIVVSPKGNFEAVNTLNYDKNVEEFVEGGDASASCATLNNLITEGISVIYEHISEASRGVESNNTVLLFKIREAKTEDITTSLSKTTYALKGFGDATITLSIEAGSPKVMEGSTGVGEVVFYKASDGTVTTTLPSDFTGYYLALKITGADNDNTSSIRTDGVKSVLNNNSLFNVLSLERVDKIEAKDIKALIFPKNATSQEMTISFAMDEEVGKTDDENVRNSSIRNKLSITVGSSEYSGTDTIEGTIDTSDYSSQQFNEVANSSYDQDAIAIYIVGHFTDEELTTSKVSDIEKSKVENTIALPAGIKLAASMNSFADAWACAEDSEFDDVVIFFDSEVHKVKKTGSSENTESDGVSSGFSGLKSTRPLCNFIYNKTVAKDAIDEADACVLGNNFYTISNLKKVTYLDPVATSFESPCTGAYASMIATIIDDAYGGVAPMFLNSNGMGGQLSFPVGKVSTKMIYNYSSDNQKALEKKNYNPIIYDNTYGTMVTAQRTNAGGVLTDWSYIGHVCSFLLLQREIRTNVMIPQLGKANNDYYRTLRAEQVSQLLRYRLEGSNAIWNAATVDTSTNAGVNDTAAQKAKKFIINVRVKPEPYSEYVVLNFTNYNDSSASEATVV